MPSRKDHLVWTEDYFDTSLALVVPQHLLTVSTILQFKMFAIRHFLISKLVTWYRARMTLKTRPSRQKLITTKFNKRLCNQSSLFLSYYRVHQMVINWCSLVWEIWLFIPVRKRSWFTKILPKSLQYKVLYCPIIMCIEQSESSLEFSPLVKLSTVVTVFDSVIRGKIPKL